MVLGQCLAFLRVQIQLFNLLISYLQASRLFQRDSSLICGLTLTILARLAKLRVERVSWKEEMELAMVAMMKVLELPPRESLRRVVSLESRQGMCDLGLSLASALMTIPRVERDLLMLPASFSRSPVAAVSFCLSEPARSTKCSLGVLRVVWPWVCILQVMEMVKTEWEREDYWFMRVSPTCLFFMPVWRQSSSLGEEQMVYQERFSTNMPFLVSWRMLSFLSFLGSRRSMICSLQSSKQEQLRMNSALRELILVKSSLKDLCMRPFQLPSMVQVLPEPVWPQTKTHPLQPSMVLERRRCPMEWKMSYWVEVGGKILSKAKWCLSSLSQVSVKVRQSSSSPGFTRMNTWIESYLSMFKYYSN